jgi:neopullulanase
MATLFQMTYPGAPSVYYGDEIGLTGTVDYDTPLEDRWARRTFPWDRPESWDRDLLAYFQAAIALRHKHRALRRGHFYQLLAEGQVFAYARRDAHETLLVALNASEEEQAVKLPVGAYFHDGAALQTLLTSNGPRSGGEQSMVSGGQVILSVPPREGVVLGAA